MDATQRMVPTNGGKRIGIKLDQPTWQAIDWLSGQQGKTWQQWCANVIETIPNGENLTACVRATAMDSLLQETVFAERADALAGLQPLGFQLASVFYRDRDFNDGIEQATIEGRTDLFSVEVMTGMDEFGRVAFYIRNKLQEAPHMIISTPFKPAQWLDAEAN
jgi:predicted DNA-binding ribbon-helix-helix protein